MGSFARLFTVGAVTALSASTLVVAPATADTSPVPAPSAKNRASSAPETRGDARTTRLRIKIKGVSAGARASVTVTGPQQRTKGKLYSKVIHRSKTLKVRPGKYTITSGNLGATGGTDVPKKATKTVRVRKNKIKTRTMRYVFYAATPVKPATCAEGGTCVVGDTGRGGGQVFYVDYSRPTGSQVFEAAPNGWNTATPDADPRLAWGVGVGSGQCGNLSIATGTGIGTGEANTTLITSTAACAIPAEAPAAWAAMNYAGGSLTDWFLPSKDELNQLCKWARSQSTAVADQTTVCDSAGSLADGFATRYYWSSSQSAALFAWVQIFTDGSTASADKSVNANAVHVRPIRAF